jgi:uncharacterized membrane protein
MVLMPVLIGAIFIVAGILSGLYPPKKISHYYGYRTRRSMRDQESWDFANRFAPKVMTWAGVVSLLIGLAGWAVLDWTADGHFLFLIGYPWVFVAVLLYIVESRLKREFGA